MFKNTIQIFVSIILISQILFGITGQASDNKNTLKIWALSDIQPRNESDKYQFENAVDDINSNIKDIDIAIVAGDIVNRTEEETFRWYLSVRKRSYIKKWYEIAGNHDLKTDKGKLYRQYLNNNFHYRVDINNVVFLFMSDEKRGKPTEISDETFSWWKEQVLKSGDKIIFVISHAPLKGSELPFSSLHGRNIVGSGRFVDILKQKIIDVWLSGHLHLPHSIMNNLYRNTVLNNTIFVNVSSIRPELLGFKDSESFIISMECDSDIIHLQSRNHEKRKFNEDLDYRYQMSKQYLCN